MTAAWTTRGLTVHYGPGTVTRLCSQEPLRPPHTHGRMGATHGQARPPSLPLSVHAWLSFTLTLNGRSFSLHSLFPATGAYVSWAEGGGRQGARLGGGGNPSGPSCCKVCSWMGRIYGSDPPGPLGSGFPRPCSLCVRTPHVYVAPLFSKVLLCWSPLGILTTWCHRGGNRGRDKRMCDGWGGRGAGAPGPSPSALPCTRALPGPVTEQPAAAECSWSPREPVSSSEMEATLPRSSLGPRGSRPRRRQALG